jgi:hypothetical protein
VADDLKLKGPVREIGIIRDKDRHDSFNITIGITIKTEGKVTYEEAERISTKFRREYLGKDVEFRAIHIPCPHCEKIVNSETGLKQHILKIHPEKAELLTPPKVAAKVEEPKKKTHGKKAEKPVKKVTKSKARSKKSVKTTKSKAVDAKAEPALKKTRSPPKVEAPVPIKRKVKSELAKPAPSLREPVAKTRSKTPQKARQLTLA